MEIKNTIPPNFDLMVAKFGKPDAVFAYYPNIYNPSGKVMFEDIVEHEKAHLERQEKIGVIEWYNKYITDQEFRLNEEIIAYSKQYYFLKSKIRNRELKEALQEMAHALANDYGLDITYQEAESRIKKYEN